MLILVCTLQEISNRAERLAHAAAPRLKPEGIHTVGLTRKVRPLGAWPGGPCECALLDIAQQHYSYAARSAKRKMMFETPFRTCAILIAEVAWRCRAADETVGKGGSGGM